MIQTTQNELDHLINRHLYSRIQRTIKRPNLSELSPLCLIES